MITSRMSAALLGTAMTLNLGLPSLATAEQLEPDEAFFGLTYGDWSAAWWQYVLSIPADTNPLNGETGEVDCAVGQSSGPVFYLAGSFVGEVERSCDVPAGKVLFFPIINVECSTVEEPPFFGANEHELRACAAGFADFIDPDTLAVTVDGGHIENLQLFRAQSPAFGFTFPRLPRTCSGSIRARGGELRCPMDTGWPSSRWPRVSMRSTLKGSSFSAPVTSSPRM